jgi:predicted ATPase
MARRRARLTSLGPSPESLFGRAEACEAVETMLRGGSPVVTLTGPGGIGKSRVAREVGRRLAADGSTDVVLCELGDVNDEATLVKTVARSASIASPTSRGPKAVETLAQRLEASRGPLPLVVLLDDADGVVGPVATLVRACLDASAELRFLVTSRELLGIAGEVRHELGPLDEAAAHALFEASADGGTWSAGELSSLIEQLDGLPLAIELAARRSRLVPPGDLLAKIEDRFRLLKTDRRDVAARHATLSATIEWSLARLDADETRAFAAAGAFAGAFTLEAFESVVAPALGGDPVDVVEALLRKSLFAAIDTGGAVRLTMLRSLRAFARQRLDSTPPGERQALQLRHATFHVEHAERAAADAYGPSAAHALDTIEAALPELVRAFAWAQVSSPDLAARAVIALGDVVVLRSALDLRGAGAIFREATLAADANGDSGLRVRTRLVEAKVKLELAAAADAEALLVEALAIAKGSGLDDAADVQRSLGWARIALGDAAGARAAIDDALALHRSTHNVRGEADALVASGLLRCLGGDRPGGEGDLENAYALHVIAGDALRREKVREVAVMVGIALPAESEVEREGEGGGGDGAGNNEAEREQRRARLQAVAEAHRASGRSWRETVARVQLAALEDATPPVTAPSELAPPEPAWGVGGDARSLRRPDGQEIDLSRHAALRRVLEALVARRLAEPGSALSADALLEAGWPGERIRHDSGMLRVYTVVRRIRALGLGEALVTRDDGYLLDPRVGFERTVSGAVI